MRKPLWCFLIVFLLSFQAHTAIHALAKHATIGALAIPSHTIARRTSGSFALRRLAPVVALTFDDGPNPTFTPQIQNILQQAGVRATFFCVGNLVSAYPAVVRQTALEGDAVEDHSWDHPDLTQLPPSAVRTELSSTAQIIQQTTGIAPTLFRPPYGATNAVVSAIGSQLGLRQIEWTVDPQDWQRPGVAAIVQTVLANAGNGSIILLHDGGGDRSQTVEALPQIIAGLTQRGFLFTTLS